MLIRLRKVFSSHTQSLEGSDMVVTSMRDAMLRKVTLIHLEMVEVSAMMVYSNTMLQYRRKKGLILPVTQWRLGSTRQPREGSRRNARRTAAILSSKWRGWHRCI